MPGWAECADPKEWRKAVGVRGLYALLNGMMVLYVGKAERSIVARVRMHRKEGLMYSTPIAGWTSDTILSWTWEKTPKGELSSPDTDAREKATISA